MRRIAVTAGWAFLLFITFFVAVIHAGCGGSQKPPAKPAPITEAEAPYYCLQVERGESAEVIFCSSKNMCQHAKDKVESFLGVLKKKYGVTTLSECLSVDVGFEIRD